jgi:hypothetical protein
MRRLSGFILLSGLWLLAGKPDIIRARDGREIGRIEPRHGKLIARDRGGRELGSYDPRRNETRDRHGRLLYYGNTLSALILTSQCDK